MSIDVGLTFEQLQHIYEGLRNEPGLLRIITYDDVIEADNIMQIFDGHRCLIIFYPAFTTGNMTDGHFISLINPDVKNRIDYFDPLSYTIDGYKKKTPMRNQLYNEEENSLVKHLIDLKKKIPKVKIHYNSVPTQSRSPTIATCGAWCVLRCFMSELTNEQFMKVIKQLANDYLYKDLDRLVFDLTKKFR